MAGQVIGGDGFRVRVVLIQADAVREIGTELAEQLAHAPQDEVAFAAAAIVAIERKARRAGDVLRHPGFPVIGLVPGQKDPRAGLDRIGVGHRRTQQRRDRFHLQCRHASLPDRVSTGIITEAAPSRLL